MAPLALPPGPYLERLWSNGIASYTDGFNFHYYGYAEDFSGVYRQFQDAVEKLEAGSLKPDGMDGAKTRASHFKSEGFLRRSLPVFVTEYGYGLLDAPARDTVAGRVAQWRWFANVAGQVRRLRIEGPMAFLWNPYYEADLNEFGLTMTTPVAFTTGGPITDSASLVFTPQDFEEERAQPWMARIGKKAGDAHASPALAYLWDYAERNPYRPRAWSVRAAPPSPVVIDLAAGSDMRQMKSSGGYLLQGTSAGGASAEWRRTGRARVVLYNFGEHPLAGALHASGPAEGPPSVTEGLRLEPGERREIEVELAVPARPWTGAEWRARFVPGEAGAAASVFSTMLYPALPDMRTTTLHTFRGEADARTRESLATRVLAEGEPALQEQGRWLATDGVRIEEIGGLWRFYIDHLPAEPLRPAAVELPLPAGFEWGSDTMLMMDRRRIDRAPAAVGRAAVSAERLTPRAGRAGNMMDVYFRTENGNLYQTWPRVRVDANWMTYAVRSADFTMAFFGRAELPWRLADNRPASLVFFLRPATLPAIFEVRDARLVRIE